MKDAKLIPAPKDRQIRIVANIVYRDGALTEVEPYEGLAQWSDRAQDWLNDFGMSIRMDYDAELIVLEWVEACREFLLRNYLSGRRWTESKQAVSMIRALKPLPLALPAPKWMSDARDSVHDNLYKLTDSELEQRLEAQDQFMRYILDGKGTRNHLWTDHHEGASKIEWMLQTEAGGRWLRERRKAAKERAEKAERDAERPKPSKRRTKARAAA